VAGRKLPDFRNVCKNAVLTQITPAQKLPPQIADKNLLTVDPNGIRRSGGVGIPVLRRAAGHGSQRIRDLLYKVQSLISGDL